MNEFEFDLLDKHELSAAIGFPPKQIDQWTRQGMPTHKGERNTRRFLLSEVVHWLVERAGGDMDTAKLENARATAKLRQLEVEEREGKLVSVEEVTALNADRVARLQTDLLSIPSRFTADVQAQVRSAIVESLNRLSE